METLDGLFLAAKRDPAKRAVFYRALLQSELIVLGRISGDFATDEDGNRIAMDDSSVHLDLFEVEGEMVLPVFSREVHLENLIRETRDILLIDTKDLLPLIDSEVKVVLNPGTAFAKELIPQERAALLDGSIFTWFSPETENG
ncbi:SseB family protein [Brevibacillus sp. B_LB10_24]|uniref:SseB family protein n=1 Tax=Brevibacillus sp. B_LB10_24 TaxID=3380645 RepID=UPI0038BA4491